MARVRKLPAEAQVKKVAAELKRRNPRFDGQVKPSIQNGVAATPLEIFSGPLVLERDFRILKTLKTLRTINEKPAAAFWKEVDAAPPPKP